MQLICLLLQILAYLFTFITKSLMAYYSYNFTFASVHQKFLLLDYTFENNLIFVVAYKKLRGGK